MNQNGTFMAGGLDTMEWQNPVADGFMCQVVLSEREPMESKVAPVQAMARREEEAARQGFRG